MKSQPIRVVEGKAKPYEPFWQVKNALETGGDPEIEFVGYISEYSWFGDEITPKKFKEDLYAAGKGGPITIRMHSGGGEIFAAAAIRAMLIDYPGKKTVKIDGIAASAAVAIALAGDEIKIFDTSYMMVHNPGYGFLMGYLDAETLEKFAGQLKVFRQGLLDAYGNKTGLEQKQLSKMLDEETWMTAEQAVALGFADEVLTGGSPIRSDVTDAVRNYANVPPALLNAASDEATTLDAPAPGDRDGDPSEIRQEPGTAIKPTDEARARLATLATPPYQGEKIMNVRELLKEREALLARAQALADGADAESRDFTEAERDEFETIMGKGDETGKVGALDAKIAQVQDERERLRAAAAVKFTPAAEKPAPTPDDKNVITKAEFDKRSPKDRMAFLKAGGRVEE